MASADDDIVRRLKSVHGHVAGISRMVEADAYCVDVLRQILAVQRALDRVSSLVLENHLRTCMTEAVRGEDPDARERVLSELAEVFAAGNRTTRGR
jgi:DNA-binding FrmR family transcriptional regulator